MSNIYQLDDLEGAEKELAQYLFEKTGRLPGEYGYIDGRRSHLHLWDSKAELTGFMTASKDFGFTIFTVEDDKHLSVTTADREEGLKQMVEFLKK